MLTRDDDEQRVLPYSMSLTSAHISEAVKRSPDGGLTLFLSKLVISDIGPKEAVELSTAGQSARNEGESILERLALGHNRLTSLPPQFSSLNHLRYLNLRHNSFSIFPNVITQLPSLDTLDISYNKIKRLPNSPGNLLKLRILSLARNKVNRLPTYLTKCHQLEMLQLERNPLEWPPRSVVDQLLGSSDLNQGRDVVRKFLDWIESDAIGKEFDDSGYSENVDWEERAIEKWDFFPQSSTESSSTPHARSFSIDSDASLSSIPNSANELEINTTLFTKNRLVHLPPVTTTKDSRHVDLEELSASSYTPSPRSEAPEADAMHSRTASHASSLRKIQSSIVSHKKSLPDLRTQKDGRKGIPPLPERKSPSMRPEDPSYPLRNDSISSSFSAYNDDIEQTASRMVPSVAIERNSYFRRLSTTPTNHFLPKSLSILLQSARSILFAMGQLYQTLDQYVNHGVNDKLLTTFKKVLDPANLNMLHLIRSLDRFDDVGQKSVPSPAVCRALVESSRDTVFVFRKAVGLLGMQMGVEPSEDPRYVRWLVLELYAATAELCQAWQTLAPHIEALKPYLYGSGFLKAPSFSIPSIAESDDALVSPSYTDQLAPSVRLRPPEGFGAHGGGRTRTARRHAGSFSTKDVQMGKELPNYDTIPDIPSRLPSQSSRTPKRQVTMPAIGHNTSYSSSSSYPVTAPSYFGSVSDLGHHQRRTSQDSLPDEYVSGQHSPIHSGVDHRVLQAMQHAIDLAPTVWDQIEDALVDMVAFNPDVSETIEQARSVTKRLWDDINITSEGYSDADKRLLRENAHLFLKTLVHLSNILKSNDNSQNVSATLRENVVKLTHLTEEFALLLQVSSSSSHLQSSTPPSNFKYAPYNLPSFSSPPDDKQLTSSLSRSRSAQPSLGNPRQSYSSSYDTLSNNSATQISNKGLNVRRHKLPREPYNDGADPG